MRAAGNSEEWSAAIAEAVEALGYEVVSLERGGGRGRPLLRVRIDRPGSEPGHSGVTVDDCARVSRALDELLEQRLGRASESILEVSSPGIERPLSKPEDFDRFAGQRVRIRGYGPLEGKRRQLEGRLLGRVGADGEAIALEVDGRRIEVALEAVARARLTHAWDELPGSPGGGRRRTAIRK